MKGDKRLQRYQKFVTGDSLKKADNGQGVKNATTRTAKVSLRAETRVI